VDWALTTDVRLRCVATWGDVATSGVNERDGDDGVEAAQGIGC